MSEDRDSHVARLYVESLGDATKPALTPGSSMGTPEDRARFANPHVIDWTNTPVDALELSVRVMLNAASAVPAEVTKAIDAGMSRYVANLMILFHSKADGIVPALKLTAVKIDDTVVRYNTAIGEHREANLATVDVLENFATRLQAQIDRALGERERLVGLRETQVAIYEGIVNDRNETVVQLELEVGRREKRADEIERIERENRFLRNVSLWDHCKAAFQKPKWRLKQVLPEQVLPKS